MKRFVKYLLITLLLGVFLIPFIWMLLTALRLAGTALSMSISGPYTLRNLWVVITEFGFGKYFLNSIIIATLSATVSTFLASVGAYAFAKGSFPFKNFLFGLFLSSMMVPGLLYIVPQFVIVYKLRWLNTFQGMIVPHLANVFGLFLLTQFIRQIPDSLLESGRMDGATEFSIFVRIVAPISMPVIATVFLLNFQFHWSNFLWQLIVAQSESMYTIPVGLAMFKGQHEELYTLEMAAASLSVIPIGALFLFAQRYFIQGITKGAIKG